MSESRRGERNTSTSVVVRGFDVRAVVDWAREGVVIKTKKLKWF